MLQRKIANGKTKFRQKSLRGRRDATEQQREIFGICRRQAPSPLLKAIARMAPPTGEGIAGTAFLSAGDALFRRRHTVFFVLLALLYERFIEIKLSASVSRP